jgi:hypothetical protein
LETSRHTPSVPLVLHAVCGEEVGDPRVATIDWGDGTSSPATIADGPAINGLPSIIVSGEHTYAEAGDPIWGFTIRAWTINQRSGHLLGDDRHRTRTPPSPGPAPPVVAPSPPATRRTTTTRPATRSRCRRASKQGARRACRRSSAVRRSGVPVRWAWFGPFR